MTSFCEKRHYKTSSKTDVIDITGDAEKFVVASGVKEGLLTLFVPGSTASISTIEYESGVVSDLKRAIEEIVPSDRDYSHDARWGDGNGYSHVRATLMKPSLSIPIINGNLTLGTWQQIVLIDFDNKPRNRELIFQVIVSSKL